MLNWNANETAVTWAFYESNSWILLRRVHGSFCLECSRNHATFQLIWSYWTWLTMFKYQTAMHNLSSMWYEVSTSELYLGSRTLGRIKRTTESTLNVHVEMKIMIRISSLFKSMELATVVANIFTAGGVLVSQFPGFRLHEITSSRCMAPMQTDHSTKESMCSMHNRNWVTTPGINPGRSNRSREHLFTENVSCDLSFASSHFNQYPRVWFWLCGF